MAICDYEKRLVTGAKNTEFQVNPFLVKLLKRKLNKRLLTCLFMHFKQFFLNDGQNIFYYGGHTCVVIRQLFLKASWHAERDIFS